MSEQKELVQLIWNSVWKKIEHCDVEQVLSNRFTKEAYAIIRSFISIEDKLILEIGCGTGRFCYLLSKEFPDKLIIGVDISETSLEFARKLKDISGAVNLCFQKEDMFSLPFPDRHFDVVFTEGVIEHFKLDCHPNYKTALREMIRVTKPGGKVLVAVPNWYCLPHTIYKKVMGRHYEYGYEKSFTHRGLITLFQEFNLSDIELKGFYPAHSVYRLDGYIKILSWLGVIIDSIQRPIDRYFKNYFSNKFGFEIVIKGRK